MSLLHTLLQALVFLFFFFNQGVDIFSFINENIATVTLVESRHMLPSTMYFFLLGGGGGGVGEGEAVTWG